MEDNKIKKNETFDLLVTKEKINALSERIDNIFDRKNVFNQITTRAVDPKNKSLAQFHVFDENKLARIASNMPEINRATRALGRRNSFSTNKLMTLTMLEDCSPYRVLRQCLAQIENKRSALKENRFKVKKDKVKLEWTQYEISELENEQEQINNEIKEIELQLSDLVVNNFTKEERDPLQEKLKNLHKKKNHNQYKIELKKVKLEELASGISDAMLYIEGALKDLASFQSSYLQVCKNKGLPANWDESDLENAEVQHHVRIGFLHLFRDLLVNNGRIGMGTIEYLQQFGVHPMTAIRLTTDYIRSCGEKLNKLNNKEDLTIQEMIDTLDADDLYDFLHVVEEEFKDQYKKVLKEIGIDSLTEDWYMYNDPDREQNIEINKEEE